MRSGLTATVFGGTGFLGHAVVQALAAQGYHVRVPSRDPEKADDMKLMGEAGQVVPIRCSMRTESSLTEVLRGSDVVINLMGELAEKKKNGFQLVHVELAARLARLAKAEGVENFIHVSALGATASSPSRYARTKAMGEDAVHTFFPDAVILRPSVMFGPRDKFFNKFALLARYLPFLPLIGGGHTRLQPVYVGDVAAFISVALVRPDARGHVFALGGPRSYTFRELMELLLSVTGYRCALINVPIRLARFMAVFWEKLPQPPLTRDQIELLKVDNVIDPHANGVGTLASLRVRATRLEAVLPSYLRAD